MDRHVPADSASCIAWTQKQDLLSNPSGCYRRILGLGFCRTWSAPPAAAVSTRWHAIASHNFRCNDSSSCARFASRTACCTSSSNARVTASCENHVIRCNPKQCERYSEVGGSCGSVFHSFDRICRHECSSLDCCGTTIILGTYLAVSHCKPIMANSFVRCEGS